MFKSYQDTISADQFRGFPNLNFQGSNSAYGFSGVSFWLDAAFGLNTQTNLGAVSKWQARVGGGVFEQATAGNQPRLILSDANYNNFPSVEAQDSARIMESSIGLKYQSTAITVAVISKVNVAQQYNGIIGRFSTGDAVNVGITDGGGNASYNGFGYFQGTSAMQGTTESLNARIKILTSTNIIINGSIETTGTAIGAFQELVTLFRTNSQTAQSGLRGSIAEIIAFNYSMSSTDAIALSDRINQKYAIY
jgi:hypothetical protein